MNTQLLQFLNQNLFITLSEARKIGINAMMLSRLTSEETLFRTEHGVYTHTLDWLTDPLKKYTVACALYPQAIICGISALSYYGLTDEEERQTWIALPAPKKTFSDNCVSKLPSNPSMGWNNYP